MRQPTKLTAREEKPVKIITFVAIKYGVMKRVKGYPTFVDMLTIIGVMLIITLLTSHITHLVMMLFTDSATQESTMTIAATVAYPISFLLTILFTIIYRRHKLADNPRRAEFSLKGIFRHASAAYVLWGVILLLAVMVVTDPIVSLFPGSLEQMNKIYSVPFIPLVLSTIILAPLLEETLFRGILMSDLKQRYGVVLSILFSALLFGAVHLNMAQGVCALFSGIVLGYIFYVSGSLWSVIFIHMINNLMAVVVNKYFPRSGEGNSIKELIGIDWLYYTIFTISIVLLIIAAARIFALRKGTRTPLAEIEEINSEESEQSK